MFIVRTNIHIYTKAIGGGFCILVREIIHYIYREKKRAGAVYYTVVTSHAKDHKSTSVIPNTINNVTISSFFFFIAFMLIY